MSMQISATGMLNAQQRMGITAGNVANVSTPGFRAVQSNGSANTAPGIPGGSNVDLTTEQVNLLVERADFRANTAAFRAQDELVGNMLNLLG